MAKARLDAYIVPRADRHQGEYVAACDERLAWLTGFTGSAGTAVIAADAAALFVDGRYHLQARDQIAGTGVEPERAGPDTIVQWLVKHLPEQARVGVDPRLIPLTTAEHLNSDLQDHGAKLIAVDRNLIDAVWGKERPAEPDDPIRVHDDRFAGEAAANKISQVQAILRRDKDDALILTLPDSICWLFNIRGADVAHTPIVRAFAIVRARGKPDLFLDKHKIPPDAAAHLKPLAKLHAAQDFKDSLRALASQNAAVRLSPASAGWWVARQLGRTPIHRADDPCQRLKAIKNAVEIAGARVAHERDGSAMVRFLAWLDAAVDTGHVDEISAAQRLEAFRAETGALQELSFDTISGAGPNGAIVHYRVNEATNRKLGKGELFLIDSGAQYFDGTTDITRTIAIGRPTKEMCRNYTAVLKGHIALAMARFPKGTRGSELDPLARAPLWQHGLDFDHGTGHGIGSYLSVHEGPQSISKRGHHEILPGMIISNEPGYYKEGGYGIRLENLVLVQELSAISGGAREMMSFETLTLAPFDRRLIVPAILTDVERDWLNDYHARVHKTLAQGLDRETADWLKAACAVL